MEREYHELSYMKASLELVDVKEEIEQLLKEKNALDQKLERKSREQNELTEKCMRHIRVLKRKGMTSDFYCPKKRGVMVTPTKTGASSYAPNYIPSPRSYAPNYVPSPSGWNPSSSPIREYAFSGESLVTPAYWDNWPPTTPGCSPFQVFFVSCHGWTIKQSPSYKHSTEVCPTTRQQSQKKV